MLVVEDDAVNRKVILRQLGLLGYAAEVEVNGANGLARWRAGRFAIVLTDLHMPEMDGYMLTVSIREEEARSGAPRTPIVALTANAHPGEAARVKALGADEYLTKPLSLRQLGEALGRWGAVEARSAPPPASPAVFDVAVLRGLVGDDPETLVELLRGFLRGCAAAEREIAAAWAAGNTRRVGEVAHRLKSSARSVGAASLADLCADVEAAASSGAPKPVEARLERFVAALSLVQDAVGQELKPK